MPAHLSDVDPDLDIPPSTWLPAPPTRTDNPFAPAQKKGNPLAFVIAGIAIVFVVGQLISSCTSNDPFNQFGIDTFPNGDDVEWIPEDEWESDDELGYFDAPGPTQEQILIGPALLPVPEGWEQNYVTRETGSQSLILVPEDALGSELRIAWQPETDVYDASELCASTVADLTTGADDYSIDDAVEIVGTIDDPEGFNAAICRASVAHGASSVDYRVTAFYASSISESMVAISQRSTEEPIEEDFDQWDHYLTCSVSEQVGIALDYCW